MAANVAGMPAAIPVPPVPPFPPLPPPAANVPPVGAPPPGPVPMPPVRPPFGPGPQNAPIGVVLPGGDDREPPLDDDEKNQPPAQRFGVAPRPAGMAPRPPAAFPALQMLPMRNQHERLAAERRSCEQHIYETLGAQHIVDIGGNPFRHGEFQRFNVHCCSPRLSPADDARISHYHEMRVSGRPHVNWCQCVVQDCQHYARPSGMMMIHSIYYFSPDDVLDLLARGTGILYSAHHIFDRPYAKFHGEAEYYVEHDGNVVMATAGNQMPYRHSACLWLRKGYYENALGAMTWTHVLTFGATHIVRFCLARRGQSAQVVEEMPLNTVVSSASYWGPVTLPNSFLQNVEDDRVVIPDFVAFEPPTSMFAFGPLFGVYRSSSPRPIIVPQQLVEFLMLHIVGTERNARSYAGLAMRARQRLGALSLPPACAHDTLIYSVAIAFTCGMPSEMQAMRTFLEPITRGNSIVPSYKGRYNSMLQIRDSGMPWWIYAGIAAAAVGCGVAAYYALKRPQTTFLQRCGQSVSSFFFPPEPTMMQKVGRALRVSDVPERFDLPTLIRGIKDAVANVIDPAAFVPFTPFRGAFWVGQASPEASVVGDALTGPIMVYAPIVAAATVIGCRLPISRGFLSMMPLKRGRLVPAPRVTGREIALASLAVVVVAAPVLAYSYMSGGDETSDSCSSDDGVLPDLKTNNEPLVPAAPPVVVNTTRVAVSQSKPVVLFDDNIMRNYVLRRSSELADYGPCDLPSTVLTSTKMPVREVWHVIDRRRQCVGRMTVPFYTTVNDDMRINVFHVGVASPAHLPVVTTACVYTEMLAVGHRGIAVFPYDARVVDAFDTFVFARFDEFFPRRRVDSALASMPKPYADYDRWNARFSTQQRIKQNLAYDDYQHSGLERRDFVRSAFVKREILHKSTVDEQIEYVPRLIQSASPKLNVVIGPWIHHFSEFLKRVWAYNDDSELYDSTITFSSGMSADDLGAWFGEHMSHGRCYRLDERMFDVHVHDRLLALENRIYRRFGQPAFVSWALDTMIETRGFTKNGVKYYVHGTRHSGDAHTSSGNTMLHALMVAFVIKMQQNSATFHGLFCGDDVLIFVRSAHVINWRAPLMALGLEVEAKLIQHLDEASFCSGLFYPTFMGFVWGPKPGRLLFKIAYTSHSQPEWSGAPTLEQRRQHYAGVLLGLLDDVSHIPVLYDYFLHVVTKIRPRRVVMMPGHKYRPHASHRRRPSPDADVYFQNRYELLPIQVDQLVADLCAASIPGFCASSVLDSIIHRDFVEDGLAL